MVLYIENPKDATRKLLEFSSEFGKVAGNKINIHGSVVVYIYLYTHTHIHIYMHNGMLLSLKEILPFAVTWMDLEFIILSEVSQTERDKCHMISLICGI